ncbi:MAG: peptidylprolyl isomerase [bacterium]|nr:peptidylprolyl isomerase [bacterium]
MKSVRILFAAALLIVSVSAAAAQDTAQTPAELCASAGTPAEPATRSYTQAEQVLQPGVDYRAVFCTSAGPVYIDLLEEVAPITVNNFVFLAQNDYYNNTIFHRVIQDFMAQGGDPTGTGSGGPGYQFEDEFVGFLTFTEPGLLAMANAGPGTNGSQFFITTVPTPHLDFRHTIFGRVLEGQENVESIELRDPQAAGSTATTLDTVVIVEDTAAVETTYTAPPRATAEQVEALIAQLGTELPSQLTLNADFSGLKTAETVIAGIAAEQQEAFAALLDESGFQYRAAARVENTACALDDAPFGALSYTIDAFASREGAAAVLATAADPAGALYQAPIADGYAVLEAETALPYPIFIGVEQRCDQEMTRALTYWQRGNLVITAQATYPANSQANADTWLQQLVGFQIFERLFADVLLSAL